jgi:hypothetical protein
MIAVTYGAVHLDTVYGVQLPIWFRRNFFEKIYSLRSELGSTPIDVKTHLHMFWQMFLPPH